MPLYEYECPDCRGRSEWIQNIGDRPPPCPNCQSPNLKKTFHAPAVTFNAPGFYVTDNKKP